MQRLLKEPLLHFVALGALLFAAYGWLNPGGTVAAKEIVVTQGQRDNLKAQFARTWQRPPSDDELKGLVEQWVRDEIFYREGQAMGLERDDPVVRRRIAQKFEFIADGATPEGPGEAELQAWLDARRDRYAVEPSYTLRQIYFDPARRGARIDADIDAARVALSSGRSVDADSTMLPATLKTAPAFEVVRTFGTEFANALEELPVGAWAGPVRSGFGLHLVRIEQRIDGRDATLDEVRDAVERDWLRERSVRAKQDFYDKLRASYTVRIEGGDKPPKPGG